MAQGDAFHVNGYMSSTNTTQAIRPSSGVEWCITASAGSTYCAIDFPYSGNASFNNSSNYASKMGTGGDSVNTNKAYGKVIHGTRIFINNTSYLQLRSENSYSVGNVYGIQSK